MSLARDITTVGSGTLISRLVAFARDAVIAAWLGAGPFSEAFFAMLQVINFFRRLLAEGALNGAFVPIWLTLRSAEDGEANANRFTWRSLLAMLCVTGVIALAVIVLAPLVVRVIAPGFDADRRAITAFLLLIAAPLYPAGGAGGRFGRGSQCRRTRRRRHGQHGDIQCRHGGGGRIGGWHGHSSI